jgi:hypothetical protein
MVKVSNVMSRGSRGCETDWIVDDCLESLRLEEGNFFTVVMVEICCAWPHVSDHSQPFVLSQGGVMFKQIKQKREKNVLAQTSTKSGLR